MSQRDALLDETQGLPDHVLEAVVDFVRFLKARGAAERLETSVASEQALGKDWLLPEEDAAWKEL